MPGQRCKICSDPQRGAAEAAIASGESVRSVAKRLGLSYQSLDRHTRNCIPKATAKALKVDKEPAEGCQSPAATLREVANHATQERDVAFADCLMTEVELLHRATIDVLRESRDGRWLEIPIDPEHPEEKRKIYDVPNVKNTLRAIAEARKNLALIARLTGQLEPKEADAHRTITFEEFEVLYLRARREVRT